MHLSHGIYTLLAMKSVEYKSKHILWKYFNQSITLCEITLNSFHQEQDQEQCGFNSFPFNYYGSENNWLEVS